MKRITNETRISVTVRREDGSYTHIDEKITAKAGMLNFIATAMCQAAELSEMRGCHAMAAEYKAIQNAIYNLLDFRGLYDDIK